VCLLKQKKKYFEQDDIFLKEGLELEMDDPADRLRAVLLQGTSTPQAH